MTWIKASASRDNGTCVEIRRIPHGYVAKKQDATVLIRDSKNPDVWLEFDDQEWSAFMDGVVNGEFDQP